MAEQFVLLTVVAKSQSAALALDAFRVSPGRDFGAE